MPMHRVERKLSGNQGGARWATALTLFAAVLIGRGITLGQPQQPARSAAHARETMAIEIHSPAKEYDDKIRQRLVKLLTARFDIVDSAAMFRLRLTGQDVPVFHNVIGGRDIGLGVETLDTVHYQVVLDSPAKSGELLFEDLVLSSDWLLGTLGDEKTIASKILDKINDKYPLSSRIAAVDGRTAELRVGRGAGLMMGDRLKVYDLDGKRVAEVEVTSLSDSTAVTRVVRGSDVQPAYLVRQKPRSVGFALGLEYTHFRVRHDGTAKSARQIMFNVLFTDPKLSPLSLQFSTGYVDYVVHDGWHLANLDLVWRQPLSGDMLFLEVGAGGGLSLVRLTSAKDPVTGKKIRAIGVSNWDAFAGISVHCVRELAFTAFAGYLGNSRYPNPHGPTLQFGVRWWPTSWEK